MSDHRRNEILNAISDELSRSSRYVDFHVDYRAKEGDVWTVFVDLSFENAKGLDESYEGATAWWPAEPSNGAADVLSVIPEKQQINLRFATTAPPPKGELLRLYPPRYLEALREIWTQNYYADRSLSWLDFIQDRNSYNRDQVPPLGPYSSILRKNQADAFDLMGFNAGFLWGPPGTGKTFTIGAMLAQHLVTFPQSKILLLSTTNSATDQALVSVDKALERLSATNKNASLVRQHLCKRIGQHFVASHYHGREHLLPVVDYTLIKDLAQLEAQRPDKTHVQAYAAWKAREEAIREEIRRQAGAILDNVSLGAMTTTRAAFTFDQVIQRAPFGLVVFDEASQVSLAHALALAPLSDNVVFAGDPNQLAPIVQSKHAHAERWLGRSMFAEMNRTAESTCFLSEQSRMAEPICDIVSHVFYDGKLVVAEDAKIDPRWKRERDVSPDDNIVLLPVGADGTWSQKYRGPIRYKSAELVRDIVDALASGRNEQDVLILTPFRAQRTLIRTFLERAGYKRVRVSTVHKAQGSERHTLIFDPVQGDNQFLLTEDARRLVNVALSRAQAMLVVVLSDGDRRNPIFEQIATVIENANQEVVGVPIERFASASNFPECAIDETVVLNGRVGEVVEVMAGGQKFRFRDYQSGQLRLFVTRIVKKSIGAVR